MTYNDYHKIATNKFREYDVGMCNRAIYDCHDTLALFGDTISDEYAHKIWAEIDALRERKMVLARQK